MIKRFISAIHTGFLYSHLPCINNPFECLDYTMPLHNRMIAQYFLRKLVSKIVIV